MKGEDTIYIEEQASWYDKIYFQVEVIGPSTVFNQMVNKSLYYQW